MIAFSWVEKHFINILKIYVYIEKKRKEKNISRTFINTHTHIYKGLDYILEENTI